MNKGISIGLVLLILMSGVLVTVNNSTGSESRAKIAYSLQPRISTRSIHAPIGINNDTDFANQAASEGWRGTGTVADPYIIENYDIDAHGEGNAIYIGNTTVYFVVRSCTLYNASFHSWPYSTGAGIALYNVQNGKIENNTATNNYWAIFTWYSGNNSIDKNNATNNDKGIFLYNSGNNTITNNNANSNNNGIHLYNSSNNTITNNNATKNGNGIYLECSSNNNIITKNNANSNNDYGTRLEDCSNNTITNNTVTNNKYGIHLYRSGNNNIITNNNVSNNDDGIYLRYSSNNTITNNTVTNNKDGISLWSSSNNTITNNTVSNNWYGIRLTYSSNNNTITNNTPTNNKYGIYLEHSSNNTITNNNATKNKWYNIALWDSSSNIIANNNVSNNNEYGIFLHSSDRNIITNNNATNNTYGIYLMYSGNNTIKSNTMFGEGIFIEGNHLSHWNTHKIDTSNTMNGKPVYYWKNRTGGTVPPGAGEVILANCTNVRVENQNLSGSYVGILLGYSNKNTVANNTLTKNTNGIYLYKSSNNTITNNNATKNTHGIRLTYSSNNNTITNNTVTNNKYGIYLEHSSNNTITNNNATKNTNGISLWYSSKNNMVSNNTIRSNNRGIALFLSSNNNIIANTVTKNTNGIHLEYSGSNTVTNNNATKNTNGIYLWSSNNNIITKNNANSNNHGIYLWDSNNRNIITNNNVNSNHNDGILLEYYNTNNIITNNTVTKNYEGICVFSSSNNTITNNNATKNEYGIFLWESSSTIITNNTMFRDGIFIWGDQLSHWNTHIIDTSNTVNGRPVYYWKNRNGGTVPLDAGEVILANCTNVIIENQNLSNSTAGIELGYSNNNTITNNTATKNTNGIHLWHSSNNTITNNTATNNTNGIYLFYFSQDNIITNNTITNTDNGIRLRYYSHSNMISNNTVTNNTHGICLTYSSNNNTITNNTVTNNTHGIYLHSSSSNRIYHNNFINNTHQAYDDTGTNFWNTSYPAGGNYWSDYNGQDNYSGPNQDRAGRDGIGDTPYTNLGGGAGARDNYPLMHPPWYVPPHLADAPWPMFHHDIYHSGAGDCSGSNGPWEYWNFTTGGDVRSSPAIGPDGTIYFGSYDNKLYALNPDGTEKWNFTTGGPVTSSPAVARDGTIYFGSTDNNLYALYPNGSLKWKLSLLGEIISSPVIGSGGTVYIGTLNDSLYAVYSDGIIKWKFTADSAVTSSPALDFNETVYFATYNASVYAVYKNGTKKWNTTLGGNTSSSPTVIPGDNVLLIGSSDGKLYILNLTDGSNARNISVGHGISSTAAFFNDTIYLADDGGILHAISVSGEGGPHWKWNFTTGGAIHSSPAVAEDGTIYSGSDDGHVYAINPNGTEKWKFLAGGIIRCSPAITEGLIYIGSADHKLYAIGDVTPPTVTIISPSNNSILNKKNVTVYWNGSDTQSGISHYKYIITSLGTPLSWESAGKNTNHTFKGLPDGTHTVYVKAVDNAGNAGTDSVTFTVDTVAPAISITSPSDNAVLRSSDVSIKWTGSDITSGIDRYEIQIDGGSWTQAGTSTSHIFTGLSDGTHTVHVKAVDKAGNTATDSVTFTVDATEPSISITSPPNNTIINSSDITISWTGSDNTTSIDHYEVQIYGGPWTDVGTNTTHHFHLVNGTYLVYVKAVDKAGNTAMDSVTFTTDTANPTISITSPADNAILKTPDVTIEWTGSDITSGIDRYEIQIDGGPWTQAGTSTNHTLTGLPDGTHTVYVKAVDNAGNAGTDSVTFTVDTVAPAISITSPSDNAVLRSSDVSIKWTGSDITSGIDRYEIQIDGGSWTQAGTSTSHIFTGLSDGTHTVHVKAVDKAGNTATDSVTFTVDATEPSISITSPPNNTIINSSDITISWTGSDNTTSIDHYEVQIDGGPWTQAGTSTNHTLTGLPDGTHTVYVKAIDKAGNTATDSITFTMDTIAPALRITSPHNNTIIKLSDITISWTGSDNTTSIDHYEVQIDKSPWSYTYYTTYTLTDLSDGSHTVNVKAVDRAGNEVAVSATFTVDTVAPILGIASPPNNAVLSLSEVTVEWIGSDITSGIDHYEVQIDRGPWSKVGTFTNRTFTGLLDGTHTVYVRVVDKAGNVATANVTFTVDATSPTVTEHSPVGEDVSVDTVITVTFSEPMDQGTVEISVEGVNGSITWDNNTATFIPSENLSYDTVYTVYVTGSDLAGNTLDRYNWSFKTTDTGTITGKVVDENGKPIPGALVTLDTGETTTTDKNGEFTLHARAGNHTITISKEGYKTTNTTAPVTPGQTTTIPTIEIPQTQPPQEFPWLLTLLIILAITIITTLMIKKKRKTRT